ncbi:MAG TPA: AtpZ/AtpI family protein [Bacteroidetes bacterium]|nr:AtpZ/AtpI family protein [Bacteroidota bacterium]
MKSNKKKWQQSIRQIGPYFDLGLRLTVAMVFGLFGGLWLDRKIHTIPLFLIIGIFAGALSGFWSIYKTIYMKNKTKDDRDR